MGAPRRGPGGVFDLKYHLVWCPKYRRNLPQTAQRALKLILTSVCEARGWTIHAMEVMPDHVHLFLQTGVTDSPASVVKVLKGVSAKALFENHAWLRMQWPKGHLWSPSYYIGTVGHVSEETVKRYVETQKRRTVGRPRRDAAIPPPTEVGGFLAEES